MSNPEPSVENLYEGCQNDGDCLEGNFCHKGNSNKGFCSRYCVSKEKYNKLCPTREGYKSKCFTTAPYIYSGICYPNKCSDKYGDAWKEVTFRDSEDDTCVNKHVLRGDAKCEDPYTVEHQFLDDNGELHMCTRKPEEPIIKDETSTLTLIGVLLIVFCFLFLMVSFSMMGPFGLRFFQKEGNMKWLYLLQFGCGLGLVAGIVMIIIGSLDDDD